MNEEVRQDYNASNGFPLMTALPTSVIVSLLALTTAFAETWTGTIVDVMCKGKDLSSHTSKCAVMPGCAKSGFGVVLSDGKFLKFDETGNAMALKRLKAPGTKDKDLKAKVVGSLEGEVIKVESFDLQ
jgi:hypothetical protein